MGVAPKKRLGQHFLTAPYYCRRIAEAVPASTEENVLEIGPGKGALSIHLKERFPRFHCVEKDADVLPILRDKLGDGPHMIHRDDAMRFDFSKAGFPLHVVGNLPYSVGAMLIKKTLFYGPDIRSCTFMVQKEVARRIVSGPHSRNFGFLSVLCQYFGKPRLLFSVPPGAFFPKPKVDSAVFQIIIDPASIARLPSSAWPDFFAFVTKGFSMRRKRLAKVLVRGTESVSLDGLFESLGIEINARAEDVSIEQWVELFRKLCVAS